MRVDEEAAPLDLVREADSRPLAGDERRADPSVRGVAHADAPGARGWTQLVRAPAEPDEIRRREGRSLVDPGVTTRQPDVPDRERDDADQRDAQHGEAGRAQPPPCSRSPDGPPHGRIIRPPRREVNGYARRPRVAHARAESLNSPSGSPS